MEQNITQEKKNPLSSFRWKIRALLITVRKKRKCAVVTLTKIFMLILSTTLSIVKLKIDFSAVNYQKNTK